MAEDESRKKINYSLKTTSWTQLKKANREDVKFLTIVGFILLLIAFGAVYLLFSVLDQDTNPVTPTSSPAQDESNMNLDLEQATQ
ncbi:MAG: hypothetical protein K8F91_23380 [Candidatus Obscuribacterales bacterium]|nr:hypothetical protein [Candidatus Obscuribacterales bacterium]